MASCTCTLTSSCAYCIESGGCETARDRRVLDAILTPYTFPGLERDANRIYDKAQSAVKFDGDKERYDLLPAYGLDELARVMSYGAQKYADRNWEKGMPHCRIFAALMRHCWAWLRGETHDKESGLHHMAHAAFGCLALVEYYQTGAGEDDRPNKR